MYDIDHLAKLAFRNRLGSFLGGPLPSSAQTSKVPVYDLVLLNATTLGDQRVDLAVAHGRIVELAPCGRLQHQRSASTLVLDAAGRLLTPGLWDSHIHLYPWAQSRGQINLSDCTSPHQLVAKLTQAQQSQGWLLGHGWNTALWSPNAAVPTRLELDHNTGERPTLLWCSDLHSALANTAALKRAGLWEPDLEIEGGVIERCSDGRPTGWLKEMAANQARQAVPEPEPAELERLLESAAHELLSLGVTGVCDQRIKDQNDGQAVLSALLRLEQQERWPLRTSVNLAAHHLDHAVRLGLQTGFGSQRVRFGHMKLFADGTLGSRTARMLEPFCSGGCGPDGRGIYLTEPDQLRQSIHKAARAGWSVSVHAIGDEAIRLTLDSFEQLDREGVPRPRIPHRIEHVQILHDDDVRRFAQLDLTASVQAGHLLDDRAAADQALGPRAFQAYRFADLVKSGARLAFGTDAPVSRVDPSYGLQAALHRRQEGQSAWFPQQCLPPEVVWQGYTENAALASGWEDLVGKLESGLAADLVCWEGEAEQAKLGHSSGPAYVISGGKLVRS